MAKPAPQSLGLGAGEAGDHRGEGLELVGRQAEVADPPALAALDELVADLADVADERVRGGPRLVRGEAEAAGELLDDRRRGRR